MARRIYDRGFMFDRELVLGTSFPNQQHSLSEMRIWSVIKLSCGAPQLIAPELVGWRDEELPSCYWIWREESVEEGGSFLQGLKPKLRRALCRSLSSDPLKGGREKQVPRLRSG
jgi:hypothetical protein